MIAVVCVSGFVGHEIVKVDCGDTDWTWHIGRKKGGLHFRDESGCTIAYFPKGTWKYFYEIIR